MATSGIRSVEDVEAEAAAWAAKLDAAPDQHHTGLDDWFARDPKNAGALLRAQAALALFEPEATSPAKIETRERNSPDRRRILVWGGAFALAVSSAALFLTGLPSETYTTHTGEFRSLALSDGSSVAIDAQSRIDIAFTQNSRDVHLATGRVLFRAAHSMTRPFRVIVDDIVVTDIGTAFQVERAERSGAVDVLVTEGAVRVDTPSSHLELKAGQRASFPHLPGKLPPQAVRLTQAGVERQLSWREGRLELDGETLDTAISEMNRHSGVQLRVGTPALGRASLYGSFRMDDSAGFARAVAVSLGTKAHLDAKGIVIGEEKTRPSE